MRLIQRLLVVIALALCLTACGIQSTTSSDANSHIHRLADGIIVSIEGSMQKVRLRVVSAHIIHVTVVPRGSFKNLPASLMAIKNGGDLNFTVHENHGNAVLDTPALVVLVSLHDGQVRFHNHEGKTILAERPGGHTFTPTEVQGKTFFRIRQQWRSHPNEAFYGLGQHQEGVMDYKGRNVRLAQHNMDIAIPFVVSSRNYGVLWDTNSITRFGNPRPYRMINKSLKLLDANGKPGDLTASYYLDGKLEVRRDEPSIDYKFRKDLKHWPTKLVDKNGKAGGKGQTVEWKGEISSKVGGVHRFRLYVSGGYKLYINHKLVVHGWRQSGVPWYRNFTFQMHPGVKYPIDLKWAPHSGFIALEQLNPLPYREQNELSFYSQLGKSINYFFIAGKDMHDVISGYRQITGKALMLPRWAYGFWQSRNHYRTQKQILHVVDRYRALKLPLDNIVQDSPYWKNTYKDWGSEKFDRQRYPHPRAMIKKLHTKHIHFMISVWPRFARGTKHYKQMAAQDYLLHPAHNDAEAIIKSYYAFYDPYSALARHMYWQQIYNNLGKLGVDAWWLDADEPQLIPNTSIAAHKLLMGRTRLGPGAAFYNSYPLMTTTAVYKGSQRAFPNKRVFILSRSAFAGQQRNAAASWSGDVPSTWRALRDQISGGINFSMSGIPNWTTDIGGYQPPKRYITAYLHRKKHPNSKSLKEWRELYLRWFQFEAFLPIFRAHGVGTPREIYNVAAPGSFLYKSLAWYDNLRYRLMPYIYTLAANTWWKNGTIMQGLPMDFPKDPKVRAINNEYMFGPAFLVAPVTHYKARMRKVYLPAGTQWYNFNTGKWFSGGQTVQAPAPLSRMPVFVRAGSIVPTGQPEQYTNEHPNEPITLLIYGGANGHFSLYEDDGKTYGYEHGHYSRVPFSYNNANRVLTLGKREGDGTGAPTKREFIIRLIDVAHPNPYGANGGNEIKVKYVGNKMMVHL